MARSRAGPPGPAPATGGARHRRRCTLESLTVLSDRMRNMESDRSAATQACAWATGVMTVTRMSRTVQGQLEGRSGLRAATGGPDSDSK
jgi:hypothetical protein